MPDPRAPKAAAPGQAQYRKGPGAPWWLLAPLLLGLLVGCGDAEPPATAIPRSDELVILGFADDMPQVLLEAFAREQGIRVRYVGYQSPEEAAEQIRAGAEVDLVVVENQLIPALATAGLLAEIDWGQVPHAKNIARAFRDLAIDPGNRFTVPGAYGTTGLLVRADLVGEAVTGWGDLWDPRLAGRIGLRVQPREVIGLTLASLGHDASSEDPRALAAAAERLLALRGAVSLVDYEASEAAPRLLSGEVAILHGYAEDYRLAREANPAVAYVLPREGTILWEESYVIPARSRRQDAAHAFLDFLLRGDIAALDVNESGYPQANDAAPPFIAPHIRNDPVVFPPQEHLRKAHHIRPLSAEGERRYAELWARFLAADTEEAP